MSQAKIISFINYKGGVGKTTTTYHVGCSLAQNQKKRVLLVDIDPQTNLTFLCAPYERWLKQKRNFGTLKGMYELFRQGKNIPTDDFIWKSPIILPSGHHIQNLDLIPSDMDLLGEDLGGWQKIRKQSSLQTQAKIFLRERYFLRKALSQVASIYDYILIDCPPNLYLMTQNALLASNSYIITTIPDHLSTIGLSILIDKVKKIGEEVESAKQVHALEKPASFKIAKLGGVVFVRVRIGGQRVTTIHRDRMTRVRSMLDSNTCFQGHTTEMIGFSEAAELSIPVWEHSGNNAVRASARQEYQIITREFLGRF